MGRFRLVSKWGPRRYEYNLIVVGAGSAGLVSAFLGSSMQAKVALIEQGAMGGDCLNTGCVPSKALIRTAKLAAQLRQAQRYGFNAANGELDFAQVMERVQQVIKAVEPHDSAARYRSLGVDCFHGRARLVSPHEVEVDGRVLSGHRIILATGANPRLPDLPGLDRVRYLTSDTIWQLRTKPERLVVVGGGPIGCEMAQTFARLGCQVVLVLPGGRLLAREDVDVSQYLQRVFKQDGVEVLFYHELQRIVADGQGQRVVCRADGQEVALAFDEILFAIGRQPATAGLGLDELGVAVTPQGGLAEDGTMRTSVPSIYCAGDVAGPYLFTHMAAHQAGFAVLNALFGRFRRRKVDYRLVPWATFVDPEVARVGLNEQEAKQRGVAYDVTRFDYGELDRAIADSETEGWIKILTVPGRDKILGVTIVGSHASDCLAEYILAMKHGLGLKKILSTIHIYPTVAEGNRLAAGVWRKEHLPAWALRWLRHVNRWSRGAEP